MRVLISGSHGLIGAALVNSLRQEGHAVARLVRREPSPSEGEAVAWNPRAGQLDAEKLLGFDCMVHLAGENIAQGRWSAEKKQRIVESRVRDTRLLASAIASLPEPRPVLLCASATGFYGDCGDRIVDETAAPGDTFLADVCGKWEAATDPAREVTRVVNMRLGAVISPAGGMLRAMLPLFRYGLGAPVGSGRQYVSWIHVEDALRAIRFLMETPLAGPVNLVSPQPVTNSGFSASLERRVGRPWMQWTRPLRRGVPTLALDVILGPVARELLLVSIRAVPSRLQAAGFRFCYPELDAALVSFSL